MSIRSLDCGRWARHIAAGWVCVAVGSGRMAAQEPFPGLDAYVTKAMADWKVPGLGLAIVRNDSVLYARGYGVHKVGTSSPVDDRTLFEIGSIISSARDMAQWLRFQLGDGTMGGKRLLSAPALRETHSPQILIGAGAGNDSLTRFNTYGLGWFVEDYRQHLVWQHGGNTDGMTTAMGMLPERKFGVVVLSSMHGTPLPGILMRYLFDRQLGAPMRDLSAEALSRAAAQRRRADSTERVQETQRIAGARPPLPLSAYAGTYVDSLYGDAVIALEGERLILKRGEWTAPLEYWNGNSFRWVNLPSAAVTSLFVKFDAGVDGKVTTLMFGVGADTAFMIRKPVSAPRAAGTP